MNDNAIDRAAKVLEAHEVVFIDYEVGYECGCNEHGDGHPDGLPFLTDALRHQAQALHAAGLLVSEQEAQERERAAVVKALREAADEMDAVIMDGDVAEVAAPVPGEIGRSAVVARRDALHEDPSAWLRKRWKDAHVCNETKETSDE